MSSKPLDILKPRRSPKDRRKNYIIVIQKQIQQYIKNGCQGDLDLSGTPIDKLPENLKKVGGKLDLSDTNIYEFPPHIKVNGSIYLTDTPIKSLPNNLQVYGDLDISFTHITRLPDNLTVHGGLFASNSALSVFPPKNLKVYNSVDLDNTLFSMKTEMTEHEIKSLADIRGDIFMSI